MDSQTDYSNFQHPLGDANPVSVNNDVIGEIPRFARGFDLLLLLERDLTALINKAMIAAKGPHADALVRLLGEQREQIASQVDLLSKGCDSLSTPAPFGDCSDSSADLVENDSPVTGNFQNGLKEILTRHTNLINTIEAVRAEQPHSTDRNLVLKNLAQNHEEMSWMLTALLNEDKTARSREISLSEDVPVSGVNLAGSGELDDQSDS